MASKVSLTHFIGLFGGITALYDLSDRLTDRRKRRERQSDIAKSYNMDPGSFSKMVDEFYDCVYVLKPDVQEVVDELAKARLERVETGRRNSARILRLATDRRRDTSGPEKDDASR